MNWGRLPQKKTPEQKKKDVPAPPGEQAAAVLVLGCLLCLLFFCGAAAERPDSAGYPPEKAAAAWETFGREHTTLTAVLGIDEYFPEDAVSVGAFGEKPKRWNFADYMRDALYHFVFGSTP